MDKLQSKLFKSASYYQSPNNHFEQHQSFLEKYFQSKDFIFPQFDQQGINNKIISLTKLSQNFDQEIKDFKSWILNKYSLSSYFKKIILQEKNVRIFQIINTFPNKRDLFSQNSKKIYIGQSNSGLKNGYGLQINVLYKSNTQQYKHQQNIIQFEAYEGFYVNDLKHGKGKYFSNLKNSIYPYFYYGRFVNGQTCQNKTALMIWRNNDFYLGKVKSSFKKQGLGVLFITHKQQNPSFLHQYIQLKKDPFSYDKVVISQWQQNTSMPKNSKHFSSINCLFTETKIISYQQFYFGQAYSYYSGKFNSHITIKEGLGLLKCINGDVYHGSFLFDQINGYGKYVWQNQNLYIGEFLDGKKHGSGFWKQYFTSDQYEGQYKQNKRTGKGEYRWKNGNLYSGQFKNDLREGFGKMVWSTGQIYEGRWRHGLQNGVGKLYFINSNTITFIRESQFINGIQMQSGQDVYSQFHILDKRKSQCSTNKSIKNSNLTSLRLKSFSNDHQFQKHRNTSQLPKINQKTASKLRSEIKYNKKSKTQQIEPIIQRMKRKIPTIISKKYNSKLQISRSLDYRQTQKLPYHNPANKFRSQIGKSQKNKSTSCVLENMSKLKRIKASQIVHDVLRIKEMQQKNQFIKENECEQKQINQMDNDEYKKIKQFLGDSLMLPIKWKNIKRKSKNFILQKKQLKLKLDESFT